MQILSFYPDTTIRVFEWCMVLPGTVSDALLNSSHIPVLDRVHQLLLCLAVVVEPSSGIWVQHRRPITCWGSGLGEITTTSTAPSAPAPAPALTLPIAGDYEGPRLFEGYGTRGRGTTSARCECEVWKIQDLTMQPRHVYLPVWTLLGPPATGNWSHP